MARDKFNGWTSVSPAFANEVYQGLSEGTIDPRSLGLGMRAAALALGVKEKDLVPAGMAFMRAVGGFPGIVAGENPGDKFLDGLAFGTVDDRALRTQGEQA